MGATWYDGPVVFSDTRTFFSSYFDPFWTYTRTWSMAPLDRGEAYQVGPD